MKANNKIMFILAIALAFIGCTETEEPLSPNEEGDNDTPIEEKEIGSGETDGYTLVWEDLFHGTTLNTDNWQIEINGDGNGNAELQYYRAENISVGEEPESKKSCLILTAKKENYAGKSFTSGRLNTNGKYTFTYGKVEASIKLPKTANGLWPAFWLLGKAYETVSWPACSEIDILEMGHQDGIRQGKTETYFNGAIHWGTAWDQHAQDYGPKNEVAPYSLQDGKFHLYTLIWNEEKIAMYLDLDKRPEAKPYFEMAITDKSDPIWSPGNYLHQDCFIIFNLAVGGNFPGIWNPSLITALPDGEAKMYVDFVKVYQK